MTQTLEPSSDFTTTVRVYFEDTDAQGVVYHANYLRFFERARTDFLRALGFEQRGMLEAQRLAIVISSVQMRFARPAKLDDLLAIRTRVTKMGRASFTFDQSAWRDGQLVCQAELRVACVGPDLRPAALPEDWYETIKKHIHEGD